MSTAKRNPLTVTVLNDYCHINGGASRVAIDEALGLAAAGVNVVFLGANGPVCDELARSGIRVICLGQRELLDGCHAAAQGLWNFTAYRTMKEILRLCDPAYTVAHLHGYTKALSTSPVRCAANLGFKVVCTLHDFYAACPNGAFFNYATRTPCALEALSVRCVATHCDKRRYAHKLYRVARSATQKWLGQMPSYVTDYITLSRQSEACLKPYLPPSARYYPLENPTGIARLPAVNIAANNSLMVIGRLDVEKGIDVLLEAVRQLQAKAVFVGDGPLRGFVEATPGCSVTGWLAPAEVTAQLDRARCLVFPSLWYETYGLAVAEASARGVPAIASDISAASERVEDGITGWIARTGDVHDLMRCIRLTQNDAALQAIGEAVYNRFWAAAPTYEAHTKALLGIYASVLANAGRKAVSA